MFRPEETGSIVQVRREDPIGVRAPWAFISWGLVNIIMTLNTTATRGCVEDTGMDREYTVRSVYAVEMTTKVRASSAEEAQDIATAMELEDARRLSERTHAPRIEIKVHGGCFHSSVEVSDGQ